MLQHQVSTNETTSLSSLFPDNPAKTGFYRGSGFVEVLTIKAHPRFKPETVPGTKTSQLDWCLREEFGDFDCFCGRDRDLQTTKLALAYGRAEK